MLISYDDAIFYKLLLHTGFIQETYKWLDEIAYNNETLDDINLELVCNKSDINKLISLLDEYLINVEIDYNKLHERLRLFIKDSFYEDKLEIKQVVNSLYNFTLLLDKIYEEKWSDFYLLGEYYYLVESERLDYDEFCNIVIDYLNTGNKINEKDFWKKYKYSFKNIIKEEKKQMNPIRVKVNFVIIPIYAAIMMIILTTIGILLSIDEDKFTVLSIVLFIIFFMMIILLLISIPIIRKKEVEIELKKYDFSIQKENKEEYTLKTMDNIECIINKEYLMINNKKFKHDDFCIEVITYNYLLTVQINIEFVLIETNELIAPCWNFKLDNELLNALVKFNIEIINKEIFDYIINNKEEAFRQILKYGYIKKLKNKI